MFPIVWMVIIGAASVALLKIAFFPDRAAEGDPTQRRARSPSLS
ncbi:hypothetical protein [Rathayibacter tanaceti]|nr:hypothetical protein [Rathayibacter tanaceti]